MATYMNSKKERLTNVEVYFENEKPYMKLVYEYEDKAGIHEVIFPKVDFPLLCTHIPNCTRDEFYNGISTGPYIRNDFKNILPIFKGSIPGLNNNKPFNYMDRIIKPKVHEMTLEEIEKELGYSIKIVSKENNDGAC